MKKKLIVDLICGLLILLFVYAAASKILDYEKFSVELGKSPLLTKFAGFTAVVIPLTELLVSVLLATKRFRLVALFASFFLMAMFTAYIIVVLNFSYYIPCSCGGVLQKLSWNSHIIFNLFFLVLSAAGVLLSGPEENTNSAFNDFFIAIRNRRYRKPVQQSR